MTDFAAPSATRRLRNHVKKIIGKPCAGKPHARIERGTGKGIHNVDTAPLTTNEWTDCSRTGCSPGETPD